MSGNDFLQSVDERMIRHHILTGLKGVHRSDSLFSYSDVCHFLAIRIWPTDNATQKAMSSRWTQALQQPQSVGDRHQDDADTRRIAAILWTLVAQGTLYPRFETFNTHSPRTDVHFGLTPSGIRLLADLEAHPLSSSFTSTFRSRAPLMTEDVVACVENAAECLRHHILRAGVLLIGVAAEITVRTAHDAMVASGFLTALNLQPGQPPSAKRLLDRALEEVAKKWPKQNEEQRNLKFDLMSLDSLREARNRAAHPEQAQFSPEEVERYIDLSSKSIARIWQIVIEPAVRNGQFLLS